MEMKYTTTNSLLCAKLTSDTLLSMCAKSQEKDKVMPAGRWQRDQARIQDRQSPKGMLVGAPVDVGFADAEVRCKSWTLCCKVASKLWLLVLLRCCGRTALTFPAATARVKQNTAEAPSD